MNYFLLLAVVLAAIVPVKAFFAGKAGFSSVSTRGLRMVATEEKQITTIDAPDFYWKFRLDRLVSKKGGELAYKEKNYPDVSGYKQLYDSYYLDLTLQGKLEGFDWEGEKEITDSDWLSIYNDIAAWSKDTAKKNKPDNSNLPESDFDLLKQFYPQLDFRELNAPFAAEEVGSNFPYKNMKEMLAAANKGQLKVSGYSSVSSLEATEAKAALQKLKDSTMKKVDEIYEDAMKYAKTPFPDDAAKNHYKTLKAKLADFPQGEAGWKKFRANMEKEVDEMARLASKKVDHHHHHGEDAGMSPAEEFEAKYGKSIEVMQERMNKYKSDPQGFLESSIVEKYGKDGLEVWKKSQEFSAKASMMSAADKEAVEKKFSEFLSQA